MKLDRAGFDVFFQIKKELYKDNNKSGSNKLGVEVDNPEQASVLDEVQKEVEALEKKYANQEQRILQLQEENNRIKTRLHQAEFFA